MKYYKLKNKESKWGDYGDILIVGMNSHLPRLDGLLQLERTGPFQPNMIISGIGHLLVTETFKSRLQEITLIEIYFKPVIKKHISFIDWKT